MYYPRLIDRQLIVWKNSRQHKPLLLRGARQVGKSYAVRHLGECFSHYLELNFELRPELCSLFDEIHDVHLLVDRLSALYMVPVVPGETLLFLDEIQACPEAIRSLWRFREDFPNLHVIAAGSLLEFVLKELRSFGVGRIHSLFMYPMSFDEFLEASGKQRWLEEKRLASADKPLFGILHDELVQMFRTYLLVGGMPACVAEWVETHDYTLCASQLDEIRQSYYDDFSKYGRTVQPHLLRTTLQSVVQQTGSKFVYSRVEGGYTNYEVKKALQLLIDAGLVRRVCHTAANGLPLGAEINDKFRKYIFFDSGLMLRMLDVDLGYNRDLATLVLAGEAVDLVNKGGISEMVTGLELVKYASANAQHDLYYWENLKNGTTSEVDYILVRDGRILPLEVKAGITGKMKSLRLFMTAKSLPVAVRCSLENFGKYEYRDTTESLHYKVVVCPLYAISSLSSVCKDT